MQPHCQSIFPLSADSSTNVTRFEKTRLPHTQYQTYDFTRNGLLAQYTIIFHCASCSKVANLVSLAAFIRPCVSLAWHFGVIRWSWLSCIGAWRAGQCLLSSIWSAVSTRKVQWGWASGFQLSSYSILYSYIKPTHHPYYYHLQYHYGHKKSCSKQPKFWVFESYSPTQ